MAKCGVERYDNLPARVEFIDVDYLRYKLLEIDKDLKEILRRKVDIQSLLEKAYEINKKH